MEECIYVYTYNIVTWTDCEFNPVENICAKMEVENKQNWLAAAWRENVLASF
jgi:hypothetical protein